ncbi:MAG: leucine-rich repeat domain-containing protein [Bacteroidales bacterium]|nr:leucine-rich repeat domain-containing protein [Bacteroidales bacterium]
MRHFITLAFTALLSISALAQTKINGIYYNLDDDTKTASVANKPSDLYKGDIVIPEIISAGDVYTVTEIGEGAFYYCKELTSVTLPNTITTIATNAFYDASALNYISIPASVVNFGNFIFNGSGIEEITLLATVPPSVTEKTFKNFAINDIVLEVPEGSVSVYKTDAVWGKFKSIIPFPACNEPVDQLPTAIENIAVKNVVSVLGNTISVQNAKNVAVYNVMGACISKNNTTTVANTGVYFVVADGKSYTVCVK